MAIQRLGGAAAGAIVPETAGATAATATSGVTGSFGQILEAAAASDSEANSAVARMLDGSGEVHDAMIALQQADLMLQFTVQVRNKIVQAYQDIMRMPV